MEDVKKNPSDRSHSKLSPANLRQQQANRQADAAGRYAAYLDQSFGFKADRSPAQRDTSRRNGAKSHGPITAKGKARSSANSLKHGLLARLLSPPGDAREHDRLFRRIRTELIAEFQPSTFTALAEVDRLAKLYLQSGRAEEMIESLHRPSGITQKDADAYQEAVRDRRNLRHLTRLISEIDKGKPLTCKPNIAALLAQRVANYVKSIQKTLAEETIPVAEMDEHERKEDEELKQEWAKLRPVKTKLTTRQHLSDVLSGRSDTTAATKRQLRYVLDCLAKVDRGRIERSAGTEKAIGQACEVNVQNLANEPGRLIVLQRYANGFDRSIRRLLSQLR